MRTAIGYDLYAEYHNGNIILTDETTINRLVIPYYSMDVLLKYYDASKQGKSLLSLLEIEKKEN